MAAKAYAASSYVISATKEVDGKYTKEYVKDSSITTGKYELCSTKDGAEKFDSYGAAQVTIMNIWRARNPMSENYSFGIE